MAEVTGKATMKDRDWFRYWEKYPQILWGLAIGGLLLVGAIAFLWHLGSTGLIDETEPLFAEAARQMVVTGDWITPYYNQATRFDKPPLIYWLMGVAYQVLGVNEWAVRLPSALAAIALMFFGFYTLRYFGFPAPLTGKRQNLTPTRQLWFSAILGAVLMALNPQTIAWGRIGVSDMLLSGLMGSSLLAFFWGYAKAEVSSELAAKRFPQGGYLAFYILSALAVLTKGPVGIVLPGLIIVSFLVYVGQLKVVLQEMRWLWGLAIVGAIALPWYILVTLANGQAYIDSFFGYHNIERFTSVVNNHSAPWYFYFLVVLVGCAPWSVYLPMAIAQTQFWQRSQWQRQPRSQHLSLFAFFWFAIIFLFFTIAVTKLPSYVLPLIPAAAILVGLRWSFALTHPEPQHRLSFYLAGIANIVLCGAIALTIYLSPRLLGDDPAMPEISGLLQASGLIERGVIIWLGITIAIAILLGVRQFRWLWLPNLVGFLLFLTLVITPAAFLVDSQRQLPLRQLAATVTEVRQPNEPLIMIGFEKPTLVFYTQQPVQYFLRATRTVEELQERAIANPDSSTVLVLAYPQKIVHTGLQSDRYQTLAQAGAYQLIRVPLQAFLNIQPAQGH
ncbi:MULTISPECIES: glycosyltransferase family 39 protein [Desertifilum]|nr:MULTISPECIES: glycosyltransferase family 39 protein [Desertifilum]